MPSVTKTVNKTSVNGSEVFIYTLNVSYSDLTVPEVEGKLVEFFPTEIDFQLPAPVGLLADVITTPTATGTTVEFNFGKVNAGTSLNFDISCEFGPGRKNNDTFINTAKLYAGTQVVSTATAPEVTLNLDENFTLQKLASPSGTVKPGDTITFMLYLQNLNDAGAQITNVVLTDTLPTGLIPDPTFTPIGNEYQNGGYSDPTYNNKTGSWNASTLTFSLPSYSGGGYAVTFKAKVAADVVAGSTITNECTWKVDGNDRAKATKTLTVYKEKAEATLTKYAPKYGSVGRPIQYQVYTSNTGTVTITGYELIDTLPTQVDIDKMSFTISTSCIPKYSLYVDTANDIGNYKPVGVDLTDNSPVYDLSSFISVGGRINSIKVAVPSMNPNGFSNYLMVSGTVNNTATANQVITNSAKATGDSALGAINVTATGQTILNGKSILNIKKTINSQGTVYYPLNTIPIQLSTSAEWGWIVEPTFIDYLPDGLGYVMNSAYYVYTDAMSGISYDSRNADFPLTLPTIQVLKNFNGTGRTLVRFKFTGVTLQFLDKLSVFFNGMILLNPPKSFNNYGYLGNPGDNTEVIGTAYTDADDLDGDGLTNEQIAQSGGVGGVILTTSEFSLEKWVKGNLASVFSKNSMASPGGDIIYNVNVTNNQPTQLKNIVVVDILPYVGDTGVILNTVPRGSQFDVFATSQVIAKIINVLGEPVSNPDPTITIEYSISTDPVRFNQAGTGTIGRGEWLTAPPEDVTTIRAIKVTTGPDVILQPYERLAIVISAKAPVGAPVNKMAYNSYAVMADKVISGGTEKMNPAEPNKVSVLLQGSLKSSIGQFVWNDMVGDGIYQAGEPGVNGVTVQLYNEQMQLLYSTITANNSSGKPGYYTFTGLSAGNYYVKFIPYGDYTLTVQKAGQTNGSTPNPTTGYTNVISLGNNQNITSINAGLIEKPCSPPVIYATDKCILVGATFNPMDGVTAKDCHGNSLTAKIKIIFNNVNVNVVGVYSVTYSVTDSRGQTTTKTITVTVKEKGPYYQAVTDLFESVALEEAAIALILDSEGRKIQKAKSLNLPTCQLLKVNKSVREMTNAITRLEIILQSKLELFNCDICGTGSCSSSSSDCECGGSNSDGCSQCGDSSDSTSIVETK